MRLDIWVHPRASRTAVGGSHDDALIVRVAQPAVDGRATGAALGALAEALGRRRADVRLIAGATSRRKVVEVTGDESALTEAVAALRRG